MSYRFSGVLSRSAAPSPRQIIDPVHPYCCWLLGLHDYFSRCAATCRGVPFCPCYSGVDHAADPDLCYSRVGFTCLAEHPDDADVDGTRRDREAVIRSLLIVLSQRASRTVTNKRERNDPKPFSSPTRRLFPRLSGRRSLSADLPVRGCYRGTRCEPGCPRRKRSAVYRSVYSAGRGEWCHHVIAGMPGACWRALFEPGVRLTRRRDCGPRAP